MSYRYPTLLACIFLICISQGRAQIIQLPVEKSLPANIVVIQGETTKTPLRFRSVYNVTLPTMQLFKPDSIVRNGISILLMPGGGFSVVNVEHEGTVIAKKLSATGFTVVVLTYRVMPSTSDDPWNEMIQGMKDSIGYLNKTLPYIQLANADVQQGLSYIASHAAEWKTDKSKTGVMGFSAGGKLVLNALLDSNAAFRPAFGIIVSGGSTRLTADSVPSDAAPLCLLGASDDARLHPSALINVYKAWLDRNRKAELHLYATGGHGLHASRTVVLATVIGEWLKSIQILPVQ